MIDLGWAIKWDVASAVKRTQAFDEYDIDWIEAPLGAWDPEGCANLRTTTWPLIAYGEKGCRSTGTSECWRRARSMSSGAILDEPRASPASRRFAARVEFYRRQVNAPAWSSAIVSAANLAVSISRSACTLFDFKPLEHPMQHELVDGPFERQDGWVFPLTVSRLGIDVDESVVDRCRGMQVLRRVTNARVAWSRSVSRGRAVSVGQDFAAALAVQWCAGADGGRVGRSTGRNSAIERQIGEGGLESARSAGSGVGDG